MYIGVYGLTLCCMFVVIMKVSFSLFKKKKSIQISDMNITVTLPFEIEAEILKRAPEVKSLLRFRSVSKSWKSFIDRPRFIADYHPQPPRHHILVWYYDISKLHCVSFIDVDDDDSDSHSFARHKVPLTIPTSVESVICGVYGSSKGLFCLYFIDGIAVLWNPSIRKSVTIDLPDVSYQYKLGFGVSPYSNDPKLLRIQSVVKLSDILKPRRVDIYSLSTREWRTLSFEDVPRSSVVFGNVPNVAIGKYIFWLADDFKKNGKLYMEREMIIIFDMITEKFMEIYLPDHVVPKDQRNKLSLFEIRESLAVVVSYFDDSVKKQFVHVWMMEGGVSDSFTKMYSIMRPDAAHFSLLAFRNNGHPILRMQGSNKLVVYEPDLELFTPIRGSESARPCYAVSYMETLLLLDH